MKATHPEIERKFLLCAEPRGPVIRAPRRLAQGYLLVDPTRQIRLRQCGEGDGAEFWLTVKDEQPGSVRMETEILLSEEQFDALWPLTEGCRLAKERSCFGLGDLGAEVDRYEGRHRGLVVVEVEFPDSDRARLFEPPSWFGLEITGDPAYSNLVLAGAVRRTTPPTSLP